MYTYHKIIRKICALVQIISTNQMFFANSVKIIRSQIASCNIRTILRSLLQHFALKPKPEKSLKVKEL